MPSNTFSLKGAFLAGLFGLSCVSSRSTPVNTRQSSDPDLAFPFPLSQLSLGEGRWAENQARSLTYAKFIDLDRMLWVFRNNHGVDTQGAQSNGGWDAPDFPFRSHFQGHFLTAWAQCYAVLGDQECRDRADYFVAELAKCQANNAQVGYNDGYLSGFPESEIDKVENRTVTDGNVAYYALHKTMAGLLDVHRFTGNEQAAEVLIAFAEWVDFRTGRLTEAEMQESLRTEFGGMNEILANMARYLPDEPERWLEVAARFDHDAVFDPLAENRDELSGLHANTQIPKWIGAAVEFKGTGDDRYRDIAWNAWNMTVHAHTYNAIGANSVGEHFQNPNAIVDYLEHDTAETCNSHNMLKLTRELWALDPEDTSYFDFYEVTLQNHLVGQQNPASDHGHGTYFTPLEPGGRRGIGPVWGGGTFSEDYTSFWCCQGTALETNTKLMDSIYFYDEQGSLYVNLFVPSKLDWEQQGMQVEQKTEYPSSDSTTLQFSGEGASFALKVRIPQWAEGAEITVNGEASDVDASAGSYASIERDWSDGDEVTVKLPMSLRLIPTNDDPNVAAVAYGPTALAGNYGSQNLTSIPELDLGSIEKVGEGLEFEATSEGETIELGAFNEAHGFNYNTYWRIQGELS